MNYLKQINSFWQWTMLNKLSNSAITLYFTILHLANCSYWKDEVRIPNTAIIAFSGFADNSSLTKARNVLIEAGLIKYKSGTKNSAGTYEIMKLYDEDTDKDTSSYTEEYSDKNTSSYTEKYTENDTCSDTIYKQKKNKNKNKTKESVHARDEIKYSDNVAMTVEEYNSLIAEYGDNETRRLIEILGAYKKSKGKEYRSDFGAIKKWVINARNEEKSRAPSNAVTAVYDDSGFNYDELERIMQARM